MAKVLYTAEAHVTGGRMEGHGRTSDGALEVDLRIPESLGGPGGGTNPEQLFAVGYAACFESAMQTAARRLKHEPSSTAVDSKVDLRPNGKGGFEIAAQLDVTVEGVEDEQAREIVALAHKGCPYSIATRGNMDVGITVNGTALE